MTVAAGEWLPFTDEAFSKSQQEQKSIALFFYAQWCVTCREQKPMLEELIKDKELEKFVGYIVDYDSRPDLKAKYKIQRQSALIVFKGKKEIDRNLSCMDKDVMKELFKKGL